MKIGTKIVVCFFNFVPLLIFYNTYQLSSVSYYEIVHLKKKNVVCEKFVTYQIVFLMTCQQQKWKTLWDWATFKYWGKSLMQFSFISAAKELLLTGNLRFRVSHKHFFEFLTLQISKPYFSISTTTAQKKEADLRP